MNIWWLTKTGWKRGFYTLNPFKEILFWCKHTKNVRKKTLSCFKRLIKFQSVCVRKKAKIILESKNCIWFWHSKLLSYLFLAPPFNMPRWFMQWFLQIFGFSEMTAMLTREGKKLKHLNNFTTNAIISVAKPLRKCVTDWNVLLNNGKICKMLLE